MAQKGALYHWDALMQIPLIDPDDIVPTIPDYHKADNLYGSGIAVEGRPNKVDISIAAACSREVLPVFQMLLSCTLRS